MRLRSSYPLVTNILILLGILPTASRAYTIRTQTLWDLTSEAEVIVLAHVDKTEPRPPTEPATYFRNATIAHLSVLQAFKGKPTAALSVEYPEGMRCPSPPSYLEGEQVLAFLVKSERHYRTVAMQQGTRYLMPNEIDDYRKVIQEAVAIQATQPVAQDAKTRWIVHAAARPATRWHGLFFLVPPPDLSAGTDAKGGPASATVMDIRLTPAQLKEIADGFIQFPVADHTLPMVLRLFQDYPNRAIDKTAIGLVESDLAKETPPPWLSQSIELLRRRLGDPKAKAMPSRPFWEEVPVTTLRQEWQAVRKRLRLPPVVPIKPPPN